MSREVGGSLDTSLVGRARAGDADAFDELVRTRVEQMARLAMAIVADEADARDVAQESFIAAWRQLHDLRDPASFDAWLTKIVVNRARMSLRSGRRRRIREIPAAEVVTLGGDAGFAPVDRASSTVGDDAGRLAAALEALDPDRRAILAMHHLEERPVAEIARILDIPVGTVKSRLFTARQALARAIVDDDASEAGR